MWLSDLFDAINCTALNGGIKVETVCGNVGGCCAMAVVVPQIAAKKMRPVAGFPCCRILFKQACRSGSFPLVAANDCDDCDDCDANKYRL